MKSFQTENHPNNNVARSEGIFSFRKTIVKTLKQLSLATVLAFPCALMAEPNTPMVAGTPCSARAVGSGFNFTFPRTVNGSINTAIVAVQFNSPPELFNQASEYRFIEAYSNRPVLGTPSPSSVSGALNLPSPFFVLGGGGPNGETCLMEVTHDGSAITSMVVTNFAPPAPAGSPTDVPIFSPLGLLATVAGLAWFGRRRKALKVTQ